MVILLLLAGCAPGPVALHAEEIGVVGQNAAVNGRDGGGSARVFGRSVWTYGDTTLTVPDEDGQTWHHNSVSFLDSWSPDAVPDGFTEPVDSVGAPAHLIPPTEAEHTFNAAHWDDGDCEEPCGARWAVWPGTAHWDEARQAAWIVYGLIYAEPGDFAFEGRGESVAVWRDFEAGPERPVVDAAAEHPDRLWDESEPATAASTVHEDHLYRFACAAAGLDRPCALARAALDDAQDPAGWGYWDGEGWSARADQALTLFDGAPIMSVSFNAHLDAWLLVYSPPLDGRVWARSAPELTGPWSDASLLYDPPGDDAPYDANHHPDFETDGATIFVTYSRAHGDRWFATEFPWVRITLGP